MKRTAIVVSVVLAVGFLAANVVKSGTVTFEQLKQGKAIVEDTCIECHDLEWPMTKVTDRAGWEETLTKMANTGAVLDPADRELVIEFMLAKAAFQTKCVLCHSLERPLEKNKQFQEWMVTVQRMSSKKAGHLSDDDIKAIAGFLTAKGAWTRLY
jgi:mono/diheme cytochrome c family protein